MKIIPSLILVSCAFVFTSWASADEYETDSPMFSGTSAYSGFSQMKSKISELLLQNKKLETDYALLSQDITSLKEQVQTKEEELRNLGFDVARLQERNRPSQDSGSNEKTAMSAQNELLLRESKTAFLKSQAVDLDAQIKMYKQQIQSLQNQQNVVEQQARLTQERITQSLQSQSQEIDNLKQQQKAMEYQYKLNQDRIAQLQQEGQASAQKVQALAQENKDLEIQMLQLKSDTDIKRKEVEILRDKRTLAMRTSQLGLQPKEERKAELLSQVEGLESEYKNLDQTMKTSLDWQSNKKELIENIIRIDKENQGLRQKIAALQDEIETTQ